STIMFGIRTLKKADVKPDAMRVANADIKTKPNIETKIEPKPGDQPPGDKPPGVQPPAVQLEDKAEADEEKPDLVIWHYQDPRLQSQQLIQAQADKNFSYLSIYHVKAKKFVRLADDALRIVAAAPKQRW